MSNRTPLAERINTKRGEWLYTGTIQALTRTTSSTNGNPAWRVVFSSEGEGNDYLPGPVLRTQTDSGVSYEIDNPEYRGIPVTVALTRAGRIFAIEVVNPDGTFTAR